MEKVGGAIKKVFSRASVISIEQLTKGCVNKTFNVKIDNPKKELILRLYPNGSWKAAKEAYIYNLISAKTSVPVPEVFVVDSSKKILPFSYTLLSKIEGQELTKQNTQLIEKAGEYLAKIHSIKFNKFGWIVGKTIKPAFNKWTDFCEYDLSHKLKNLNRYRRISKENISLIKSYFNKNKHLLDINVEPCLLHKDYHFSHIFVKKDKITGIIDVEWATSGHNELDLVKSLMWMFEKNKKLENAFLKGYKSYNPISKDFGKRRKLYELLISVSSALFSCELKSDVWLKHNMKKLNEVLK